MAIYTPILILLYFIHVCEAWEICYYSYFSRSQNKYKKGSFYCTTSCCGYYDDRYCCTESGMIAGAVVGGTICIVVIVGIIVCCVKSHMMKPGRVIQPASVNTVQRYQHIQLPPQYYSHLPTQPGVSNPAYPPPPPAPPGYTPQLAPVGPVQPPPYIGPPPKY